jgi:hypothetical protein
VHKLQLYVGVTVTELYVNVRVLIKGIRPLYACTCIEFPAVPAGMVNVYCVLLTLVTPDAFSAWCEKPILVILDGKDPFRVTVYPPAAEPLDGDKELTEESCGGSTGPPPPGLGVGVGVGVGVGRGAHTDRQDPSTFTQEASTIFQEPFTFMYPQVALVFSVTVRQVPSTFMYVAMA